MESTAFILLLKWNTSFILATSSVHLLTSLVASLFCRLDGPHGIGVNRLYGPARPVHGFVGVRFL